MSSTIVQSKPTICLLGDAILDNYYTLSNKEYDLKRELTDLDFNVYNYAVDHVKVADIINGIVPNENFTKSRPYSYPVDQDGKFYPLKLVMSIIGGNKSFTSVYGEIKGFSSSSENTKPDSMVVISMGGNDIYSKFRNIFLGPEYFVNAIITEEFTANYKKVIETVKITCDKIVLISVYLPYLGNGSSHGIYTPLAKPIMDRWHRFIYGIARDYNIPLLDLSRTLNVGDRSHYGLDDTRVSNVSNKCIAECISYIYSHYDGHHIYYAKNCDSSNITVE